MTSDRARVAAPGVPMTLSTGRTVNLRYGFRALAALEDEFGGIAAVQSAVSADLTGPALRPLAKALACGLMGEHDGTGQPLTAERLVEDELLDSRDLGDYAAAFGQALAQAFPTSAAVAQAAKAAAETDASRGTSGTTSAPSPSDGPTPSSG